MLMGDDSLPRVVRPGSLTRGNTGTEAASAGSRFAPGTYRITSVNAANQSWTCNGDHILVLRMDAAPHVVECEGQWALQRYELETQADGAVRPVARQVDGGVYASEQAANEALKSLVGAQQFSPLEWETDVNHFMEYPAELRAKCCMFRMARVNFPPLADASAAPRSLRARLASILTHDAAPMEVTDELVRETAWLLGLWLTRGDAHAPLLSLGGEDQALLSRIQSWRAVVGDACAAFHALLHSYGMLDSTEKQLPRDLLTDSAEVRQALLAGVIDGAGEYDTASHAFVVSSSERVMTNVMFLARSLGFGSDAIQSAKDGSSCSVALRGDLHTLDVTLSHKRALAQTHQSDWRSDRFHIERVAHADYFGFTVMSEDGGETNGRFLMSDFVVTHNTTALSSLTERFQSLGWRVFRVPEAATMLLSGGHSFANLNKLQQYQFQAALLKLMLSLEEAFITLARSTHDKCIVLCDRGTMVRAPLLIVCQR